MIALLNRFFLIIFINLINTICFYLAHPLDLPTAITRLQVTTIFVFITHKISILYIYIYFFCKKCPFYKIWGCCLSGVSYFGNNSKVLIETIIQGLNWCLEVSETPTMIRIWREWSLALVWVNSKNMLDSYKF